MENNQHRAFEHGLSVAADSGRRIQRFGGLKCGWENLQTGVAMENWPGPIEAITLFAEELAATKQFYLDVFGLPLVFEDSDSAVFKFGDTLINLLDVTQAPALIDPAVVADRAAGVRHQFTLGVEDVDSMCLELRNRGVTLLTGPIDRPWGLRTASFTDPAGHIWEIAQAINGTPTGKQS